MDAYDFTANALAAAHDDKPSIQQGRKMKLEELVQKSGDAYPWSVREVESVLGTRLSRTHTTGAATSFTSGPLVYDEGLSIREVEVRVMEKTGMGRAILRVQGETP
jgi:hypothetical protein